MTAKPRKRLQIDASPMLMSNIEELGTLLDTTSDAETVRRAVRFALQLVREQKEGAGITCVDKDGKTKLLVLLC